MPWHTRSATALLWPVGNFLLLGRSTAPLGRLFLNALRTITVYGIAAAASWASSFLLPDVLPIVRILVGFAAFLVALALVAAVFPPFRRDVIGMASARRFFRRSRAGSPAASDPIEENE